MSARTAVPRPRVGLDIAALLELRAPSCRRRRLADLLVGAVVGVGGGVLRLAVNVLGAFCLLLLGGTSPNGPFI